MSARTRLLAAVLVLAIPSLAGPSADARVPADAAPMSPLLGDGCVPEAAIRASRGRSAPLPCGVRIDNDGTATVTAVGGRVAAATAQPDRPAREHVAGVEGGWRQVARTSPQRRVNAALAYLPAVDGVVMYGGLVCPGALCSPVGETWRWNGAAWWRVETATSPPALHGAAMTYDAARRELVLFGGETCTATGCSFSQQTWTFDGTAWSLEQPLVSPPPSAVSAMAYDAASQRVVLTGGCAQGRCPGVVGTWSWNGASWQFEDAVAPPPRAGAVMATNPGGGVVLFGGIGATGGSVAETWVWDGEWTQRQPATSPPSRMYAGSAYDPDTRRVIVLGGSNLTCTSPLSCRGSYLSDTWAWDGTTWSEQPSDPAPRGGASLSLAYDEARGEVVRFGGISNFVNYRGSPTTAYESSTWLWDGERWFERRSPLPEERIQAAMGFHPGAGVLVLTGGNCLYSTTCDSWAWDGGRWTLIGAPAPVANSRASLIPDPRTGSLLMPLADAIWSLDHDAATGSWRWRALADTTPPGGNGATDAADRRGRIVRFGAQACSPCTYADRTWTWDGTRWQEAAVASRPPARAFATMTLRPATDHTVLFGGLTDGGTRYFSDTWLWDGETWTPTTATGPRDRAFTRIAADPATGEVMLVGGIAGPPDYAVLGDHWMFDGSAWRQVTGALPGRRTGHALGGYPPAAQTLLFGGQDANPGRPMSDTWIWSGSAAR